MDLKQESESRKLRRRLVPAWLILLIFMLVMLLLLGVIDWAAAHRDLGTDGDLTDSDRAGLIALIDCVAPAGWW